jgi:hypothetical protein
LVSSFAHSTNSRPTGDRLRFLQGGDAGSAAARQIDGERNQSITVVGEVQHGTGQDREKRACAEQLIAQQHRAGQALALCERMGGAANNEQVLVEQRLERKLGMRFGRRDARERQVQRASTELPKQHLALGFEHVKADARSPFV